LVDLANEVLAPVDVRGEGLRIAKRQRLEARAPSQGLTHLEVRPMVLFDECHERFLEVAVVVAVRVRVPHGVTERRQVVVVGP